MAAWLAKSLAKKLSKPPYSCGGVGIGKKFPYHKLCNPWGIV